MKIELMLDGFSISKKDFPDNLLGETMRDMAFSDSSCCGNKEAYLELVEHYAEEIIERVNQQK